MRRTSQGGRRPRPLEQPAQPAVAQQVSVGDRAAPAIMTARRFHVSVRTVTYRLAKIANLTGYDPTIPAQRLSLQASVVGARMLPWPETQLAASD